jgi:hypothetical protein
MKEGTPLQQEMFSGEWRDNRTRRQRKSDKERTNPQQSSMFAFGETYEFGASYRPWLREAPVGRLILERQDIRTPEEVERDLIREANSYAEHMFEADDTSLESSTPLPEVIISASSNAVPVNLSSIGFRKYARQKLVKLRTHS